MIRVCSLLSLFLSAVALVSAASAAEPSYELVIRGGRVVDGTGAPWFVADLGISAGRIVKIGKIPAGSAAKEINAQGLIVAPGFVDMMGQTATPLLNDPRAALNLLTQGITTINAGEGASAAPVSSQDAERLGWRGMAEYFQLLDLRGLPVNVAQTVGHTQVRRLVIGEDDRRPDPAELEEMKQLVREGMEAGAIGVSTALIYPPAVYATTDEIGALAAVAGEYGGGYYTHMRNEGDQLLEALDEALEIGKLGGTPVHVFHLKAAGRQNWGKMQLAIARIRAARAAGQQVAADIYPYVNNGLGIAAFIHPRHFAEGRAKLLSRLDNEALRAEIRREMETTGGWENWFRHVGHSWDNVIIGQANDSRYREWVGSSVSALAAGVGEDPWDTFFQLVRTGAFALPESMSDANKMMAIQQDFVSFCTDVGPAGGSRIASHPRGYGAFPRLLARYVRDFGAISLERAVAQASAAAANEILAFDRGRIAEGLAADVIVFDYDQLTDKATFADPDAVSVGMRYVLVNGVVALSDGKLTGSRSGRVLRGPGYDEASAPYATQTGDSVPELSQIDAVLRSFLRKHQIPGASLAISDEGRVVYARGFGYADIGAREQVEPTSLFRIASISKPITAVAVLQLVDQGKLSLDQRVFEILQYEPHLENGHTFDARQGDITIEHLLRHRGGWDRGKSFDAMFRSVDFAKSLGLEPPAGPEAIIRVMLGKQLDFAPGERYAYSNYGYCLLGRVIEKLSGQSYEEYVREHVLAPVGIQSMRLGATRLAGRAEGEVRYYDPRSASSVFAEDLGSVVPQPYGAWYLEAMDSHGAWLASATDLARFASAFDSPESCPLLSAESVRGMFDRPAGIAGHDKEGKPKASYYGLGWSISVDKNGNRTEAHGGSLPGTNTRLVRRPDGRNFAILFNTRLSRHATRVVSALLPELTAAIDKVEQWPQ